MKKFLNYFIIHHKISLILIILGGLFLRIVRALNIDHLNQDAIAYINFTKSVHDFGFDEGFKVIPWLPPLLPFLMEQGYYLGLPPAISGVVINVIFGALLIIAIYFFTLALFKDTKAGLMSALLVAFNPFLINISVDIIRDNIFFVVAIFAFTLIIKAFKQKNIIFYMLSAQCSLLAILTRREGIEIFAIIMMMVAYVMISDYLKNKKIPVSILIGLSVYIVTYFIILVPIYNKLSSYENCLWRIIPKEVTFFK